MGWRWIDTLSPFLVLAKFYSYLFHASGKKTLKWSDLALQFYDFLLLSGPWGMFSLEQADSSPIALILVLEVNGLLARRKNFERKQMAGHWKGSDLSEKRTPNINLGNNSLRKWIRISSIPGADYHDCRIRTLVWIRIMKSVMAKLYGNQFQKSLTIQVWIGMTLVMKPWD